MGTQCPLFTFLCASMREIIGIWFSRVIPGLRPPYLDVGERDRARMLIPWGCRGVVLVLTRVKVLDKRGDYFRFVFGEINDICLRFLFVVKPSSSQTSGINRAYLATKLQSSSEEGYLLAHDDFVNSVDVGSAFDGQICVFAGCETAVIVVSFRVYTRA